MREKFNGWRDIDSFQRWEVQDNESQKQALRKFHERERLNPYVMSREVLWGSALLIAVIIGLGILLFAKWN